MVVVTHDPAVAAALGRSVTITEGRADDRDQHRQQFVRVDAGGAVQLPPDVLASLPPGSQLRVVRKPGGVELVVVADPGRSGGYR